MDNQAEINNFIFKEVTGDLTIREASNLQGLLSLETVGGSLWIGSNTELTNVDGLANLKSIGKDLYINYNPQLENLDGLSLLYRIPRSLQILSNSSLTSLDGLSNLESVGSLRIDHNENLISIDGLSHITSVGEVLITTNESLTTLQGLSAITRVRGRLVIANLASLEDLTALSSLTHIEDGLTLSRLPKLGSLDGLSAIVSVGGSGEFYAAELPLITNFDGLSNLTSANRIRIESNAALENIDGLSGLTSLRNIRIRNNAVLQRLPTLPSVVLLDYLDISSNPSLLSLDGPDHLERVVNTLTIEDNDALLSLDGLSSLVSIGQTLKISGNLSLPNVDGLSRLRDVGSDPSATYWGPALEITENASLTDLSGLADLGKVGRDLLVSRNAALAQCTTGLHDLIDTEGVYGFVHLSENAEGCNSLAQIGIDSVTVRPGLVRPTNGDQNVPIAPNVLWRHRLPDARRADVQFSHEPNFASPFVAGNVPGNHFVLNEPTGGQEVFWRVRSISCDEVSPWSEIWRFRIGTQGEADNFLVLSETSGEFESLPESPLAETAPSVPELHRPANATFGVSTNTYFSWDSDQSICAFHLQVSTDSGFNNLVTDDSTLTEDGANIKLDQDARYYWRVRKIGFGEYSDWSQVWWFRTEGGGPGTVSLTSPEDQATNTLAYTTFTWESFGEPDGFRIQLSTHPAFDTLHLEDSTLTETSFQVAEHLATSTTYFWRVRAYQESGGGPRIVGPWSSVNSFTVRPHVELLAPTLFYTSCCGSSYRLRWTAVLGAFEYEVQASQNRLFPSFAFVTRTADTTTTFVAPVAGLGYYWRVRGIGPNGPGPFSEIGLTTERGVDPLVPKILEPIFLTVPQTVRFVWTRASAAVSYQFQLSRQSDFSSVYMDRTGLVDTSLTVENLPLDTRLYFRIGGVDSEGRRTWMQPRGFNTAKLPFIAMERGFYSASMFARFDGSVTSWPDGRNRGYDAAVDQERGLVYYGISSPGLISEHMDTGFNPLFVHTEHQPTCIALDRIQSVLYWCEPGAHRVMRTSLDNLTPEIFLSDVRPTDMELDPSGYLYWISDEEDQIGKTDIETRETQILVQGLHNVLYRRPSGLALDLDNDGIFWSADKEIWHAHLDGTGGRAILTAPGFVGDIELVRSLGKIYFSLSDSYGSDRRVWRASPSGALMQAVLSSYSLGWGLAIDDRGENQLPVELTAFDVVTDGDRAVLHWSTASESNNAGFEIQHSSNSNEPTSWEVVGYVDGAGTSTEPVQYQFDVAGLGIGVHHFRLKQIDQDGAFAFSAEVEAVVELADAVLLGEAYPNPFNPLARFRLAVPREQRVSVTLFDAVGRQVRRLFDGMLPANKEHWITIDGSHLASGVYWYRADGENFHEIRSVMLLK